VPPYEAPGAALGSVRAAAGAWSPRFLSWQTESMGLAATGSGGVRSTSKLHGMASCFNHLYSAFNFKSEYLENMTPQHQPRRGRYIFPATEHHRNTVSGRGWVGQGNDGSKSHSALLLPQLETGDPSDELFGEFGKLSEVLGRLKLAHHSFTVRVIEVAQGQGRDHNKPRALQHRLTTERAGPCWSARGGQLFPRRNEQT